MSKKDRPGYDCTTGAGQRRMFYDAHDAMMRDIHRIAGTQAEPRAIGAAPGGDHGCDPLGDGMFRMVPSGDVVNLEERNKRLGR